MTDLAEILTTCKTEERPPTEDEMAELVGPFELPAMLYVSALLMGDHEMAVEIIASYVTVGDLYLFLITISGLLMGLLGPTDLEDKAEQPYSPPADFFGGSLPMTEEPTADEVVAMLVAAGMPENEARSLIAEVESETV